MIITQTIHMDLAAMESAPRIHAVQGDTCSRCVCVRLSVAGKPWTPPDDLSVAVRYGKPDGTGGHYDTLPDGTSAWSVEGSSIRLMLAPQMLTDPGRVTAQVEMVSKDKLLATFSMDILVEKDPSAGLVHSQDYINWLQRVEDRLESVLLQAKDSGMFTGATPDFQIGEVITLPGGSDATAVISGTPEAPILSLGIPRGWDFSTESAAHPGCYYRTADGQTEWVNPPMMPSEEYRTSERYGGKTVYTQLIDCGALPNASSKYIREVLPAGSIVVRLFCDVLLEAPTGESIYYEHLAVPNSSISVWAATNSMLPGNLGILTTNDRSGYTAKVTVFYTRD